jgi:hypothetical protein
MGNQNKRTVDIEQTNQIAEWRESNKCLECDLVTVEEQNVPVNEPRSSGSLRISDTTLMGLCPLLAQSGHRNSLRQCPLLGVKRTSPVWSLMSAFDPERT